MSILNRPSDGLLSVLLVLGRMVAERGPIPKEQLLRLCAPRSLAEHASGFTTRADGHGKMAATTLTRWTQIGLFAASETDEISFADESTARAFADDDHSSISAALRTIVLAASNNYDLLEEEPKTTADFTHAVGWVLAQDVHELPLGPYKEINPLEAEQHDTGRRPFVNNTRWDGFREWATYLGFGWERWTPSGRTVFIADPTVAVRDALAEVFRESDTLSIRLFIERLAAVLPVMDGGTYRCAIEIHLTDAWLPLGEKRVSTSLSRALLGLQQDSVIRLSPRSDAEEAWDILGARRRVVQSRVTHIEWTGAR